MIHMMLVGLMLNFTDLDDERKRHILCIAALSSEVAPPGTQCVDPTATNEDDNARKKRNARSYPPSRRLFGYTS